MPNQIKVLYTETLDTMVYFDLYRPETIRNTGVLNKNMLFLYCTAKLVGYVMAFPLLEISTYFGKSAYLDEAIFRFER